MVGLLTYAVELPSLVDQLRQSDQDPLREERGGERRRGGEERGRERRREGERGGEKGKGGRERQGEHPLRQLEDKFPDNQPPSLIRGRTSLENMGCMPPPSLIRGRTRPENMG